MSERASVQGECGQCGAFLRIHAQFCSACGAHKDSTGVDSRGRESADPHRATPRKDTWDHIRPIMWLFLSYLGSSLVLGFVSRFNDNILVGEFFTAFNALVTLIFCVVYRRDLSGLLGLRVPAWNSVFLALGAGAAFIVAATATFSMLEKLGMPFLNITERYVAQDSSTWFIYFSLSIAPAIWEELAFRGVMQTRLEKALSAKEAWLVQAALFSVLHLSPSIFITHFFMGLMFGWLRSRLASIYPGMLLHGTWNAWVVYGELSGTPLFSW